MSTRYKTQKASSTEWINVLKTGCRVNRRHQLLIQKASDAQQENTPMTDKLTVYEAEILECQLDSIEDHNHKLTVALQKLSDARVSLYRAYHLGIDIDIAEEALITARKQYNAVHGV